MEKNMERELTITKTITFSHVRGTITARAFRLDEAPSYWLQEAPGPMWGRSAGCSGPGNHDHPVSGTQGRVISGHWAEEISRLLKEPVTVECGIHFDDLPEMRSK